MNKNGHCLRDSTIRVQLHRLSKFVQRINLFGNIPLIPENNFIFLRTFEMLGLKLSSTNIYCIYIYILYIYVYIYIV